MQRLLATALSLVFTLTVIAQESDSTINAPEVGFRLTIPDVGWSHKTQQGAEGLTAVAIGPPDLAGYVQLSVQVSLIEDSSTEAIHASITQLRASIAGDASIKEVEDFELEVAGQTATGLKVVQEAMGQVFRVHLVFLRARGLQYRVQFHAPRDSFDEHWVTAESVLSGFELIELNEEAVMRVRLRALATRCGSQVDWASDWNEASRKAREDQRLVVVAIHAIPGFDIGNQLNEGVFMSPEILALVKHRFVAVRWSAGQPAPFVDQKVFGLSGSTFGAGLLICNPDGEVLRQIFMLKPALVADALRETLNDNSELAPPPSPGEDTHAERIAFLIDSGQLLEARKMLSVLDATESRAITYQRARLHRITREGDAALESLTTARQVEQSNTDEPSGAVLFFDEARVWMGLGDYGAAREALQKSLTSAGEDSVRAESMLQQGLLFLAVEFDKQQTREHWLAVARTFPDQPAAWSAAAALIGPMLDMENRPDLTWPTAKASLMATIPEPAPRATELNIPSALTAALDWLLSKQLDDGGWDTPRNVSDTQLAPDPISMATQAIIIRALARVSNESMNADATRVARYREAAVLGLRRYLDDRELLREHPRAITFMDYTCWGSSYGLFTLTAFLDPEFGITNILEPEEIERMELEATHLVGDLLRIQHANGGWSYYISGKLGGTDAGAAMSFTTATVLLALQDASDFGIEVQQTALDRGYECLASLHGTNGNFEYMRQGAGPFRAGEVHPAGSAARGPVCTYAMVRGDRVETDAMTNAFETYIEHLSPFGAEARKALMHAGAAGQGSHYLLYDYSTAADALRATDKETLDETIRTRVREAILRELARCRSADGSFIDNPLIGTAAGTGLAAHTLLDLLAASNSTQDEGY